MTLPPAEPSPSPSRTTPAALGVPPMPTDAFSMSASVTRIPCSTASSVEPPAATTSTTPGSRAVSAAGAKVAASGGGTTELLVDQTLVDSGLPNLTPDGNTLLFWVNTGPYNPTRWGDYGAINGFYAATNGLEIQFL